jgi:hypothetical protein
MVFADLKSVGLLAMVELGRASLLDPLLGPPVHAVLSFPPPMRGLGIVMTCCILAAGVAAGAVAAAFTSTFSTIFESLLLS